jgi:hypothetical protein
MESAKTAWEACSVDQGALLHEVGHAFGSLHTTGIMARGYSQHWPKNFLSRTAYCTHTKMDGLVVIDKALAFSKQLQTKKAASTAEAIGTGLQWHQRIRNYHSAKPC